VLDLRATKHQMLDDIPSTRASWPSDSIRAVIAERAAAWFEVLRNAPSTGLALDGASQLSVLAGRDSLAQAQIATRLAAPKLSAADRGYTLLLATLSFTDTARVTRLDVAEHYCARLDSLAPMLAGAWQYRAHAVLANAYAVLGRTEQFVSHGVRALQVVPRMPFADREVALTDPEFNPMKVTSDLDPYIALASVLALTPAGRTRLDTLTQMLIGAARASDTLLTRDSRYADLAQRFAATVERRAAIASLIGRPAPPVHAMGWWNAGALTAPIAHPDTTFDTIRRTMSLDDGIVRVVLFAQYGWACCLAELRSLERLRVQFPKGVQVIYATSIKGAWHVRLVTPAEEMRRLRNAYLEVHRLTVPIALWVGEKKPTADGGVLPEPSPDVAAYHIPLRYNGYDLTPYVIVVDRKGIVRRIMLRFDRGDEARTITVIRALLQEHS